MVKWWTSYLFSLWPGPTLINLLQENSPHTGKCLCQKVIYSVSGLDPHWPVVYSWKTVLIQVSVFVKKLFIQSLTWTYTGQSTRGKQSSYRLVSLSTSYLFSLWPGLTLTSLLQENSPHSVCVFVNKLFIQSLACTHTDQYTPGKQSAYRLMSLSTSYLFSLWLGLTLTTLLQEDGLYTG